MQHAMAVVSENEVTARDRARIWIAVYAVGVTAAIVGSVLVAAEPAWAIRGVVGLAAVIGSLVAARRSARIGINPWLCIAAGIAFWTSGYLFGDIAHMTGHAPTHWSDAMALGGYLFVGVGLAVIARLRIDAPSRTAFLDASVLAIAGAMLIWILLVTPIARPSDTSIDRFVAAALPLGDGILLAILGWLIMAPGRRTRALSMLGIAVALLLASDLTRELGLRLSHDWSTISDVVTWCAYGLMGGAGIVATRRLREDTSGATTPPENNGRLLLLGLAIIVGPAVSILGDTGTPEGAAFVAFCSMLLGLGVIARFVNLIHENTTAHEATATSERRFRLMADSAPVGIFELARGIRVTYANREGKDILGPTVVGGGPNELLAQVDPESRADLGIAITELTEGRPGKAEVKLLGTPDRWVSWSAVPVTAPGLHLPAAFASTLDITSLKLAEEALGKQATHDPLTGLPNRRLLFEAIVDALDLLGRGQRTGTVALMFIDLDEFKMVNDILGHDAGDELLTIASTRLRRAVRAHDLVARFGGDEFVVLLQHVSDRGELHDVAQRILDTLQVPIPVAGTEAHVGASVGIATASGPDDDPDALIRNADAAMYRAKQHGRGRYEFYRPEPRDQTQRTPA